MRAGVGGWATLAVKAVCVAAVVMSAYSAVHLLGGVPGTGISAVRTMTPANRARPGAPRGAAAAAAGGDTEPTQNGPESKNDRPPSVGADHQADSQADTYSSDEMMHVVVLAVGMDASRIAAFSLARGIMVASDPKEQAITFHILSDRWGEQSPDRDAAAADLMYDHPCAKEATALLSTGARGIGTPMRHRIRLHTLPATFAAAAAVNASGFRWQDWAKHFGRNNRDSYHKTDVLLWKLVLPLVLPAEVKRAVLMDSDIFVAGDLRELWATFDTFRPRQLYAMALEHTPGYADCFAHVGVGWTAAIGAQNIPILPDYGFPAFNSGVSLIHVARLRRSKEFAKLVSSPDLVFKLMQAMRSNDEEGANLQAYLSAVSGVTPELNLEMENAKNGTKDQQMAIGRRVMKLLEEGKDGRIAQFSATHGPGWSRRTNQCVISGTLGDQDVLNAAVTEYPWMFGAIPCEWNKQLCRLHIRRGIPQDGSRAANWTTAFQCRRGAASAADDPSASDATRHPQLASGRARRPGWRAVHNDCDFKTAKSVFNRAMLSRELCKFNDQFSTSEPNSEPIVLNPGSQLPRCTVAGDAGWAPIELAVRTVKQSCVKTCSDLLRPQISTAVSPDATEDSLCAAWGCSCQGLSDKYAVSRGAWGSASRVEGAHKFWIDRKCNTKPASEYAEMCDVDLSALRGS